MKRPKKKYFDDSKHREVIYFTGYNQAIDDMDMWFDSLPLLPSKDKVLHGLRKAKE